MDEFKIATISDIHLGSKRNDDAVIIANLNTAIPDNAETADLDMIVLVGDVFDGLLNLSDNGIHEIDIWIVRILRICKKYDIELRVLRGTPSHDWKQSKRFETLNDISQIGCSLKYVDTLSIEHIDRFNLDILYVPDEWDDSAEKTLSQVYDLMSLKGIEKVDYAFIHGAFPHQYPPHVKTPVHNPEKYLELVDKLIFVGHVHTYSKYDRIFAQGSFDRLSHGEEEPKGHLRATVRSNTDYTVKFIENINAKKFITIECVDLELQETLNTIESRMVNIPDGSAVRISCSPDNPILTSMDHLVIRYPFISWSKIIRSEELISEQIKDESLDDDTFVPITITRDNISKMVMDRLLLKDTMVLQLTRVEQFLTEMR